MATDIDLFAIKERIKDILNDDTDLFDATGSDRKVRVIDSGAPRMMNNLILETTLPHIWITNDFLIDTVKLKGAVVSNANLVTEHTLGLRIIIMAEEKDGFKVEEVLDDFVKLIAEKITENFELQNPSSGADPKADSCRISQITELSTAMTGQSRQGRIISLKCVVTTG